MLTMQSVEADTDLPIVNRYKPWMNISYTVGKVFKSLTQESCKETKRELPIK